MPGFFKDLRSEKFFNWYLTVAPGVPLTKYVENRKKIFFQGESWYTLDLGLGPYM